MTLKPDLLLDDADLALLEINPNLTDLERVLIEQLRWYRQEYDGIAERGAAAAEAVRDHAKDGKIVLDRIDHVEGFYNLPPEASRYVDEAEDAFDDIIDAVGEW